MSSSAINLPGLQLDSSPAALSKNDPGRTEAWWWFGIPIAMALAIIAIAQLAPIWYQSHMHPEGYGVLEVLHFFVPLGAMLIALKLLMNPKVRHHGLLTLFVALAALACFYIAGEEMSWGQHFFHWQTPEYWSELNRQDETNLHNTYAIFDKTPRMILEIGILIGGIIIPLLALNNSKIREIDWAVFFPPLAILPVALIAAFFKLTAFTHSELGIGGLVPRPSEVTETFLYLFLLYYLIMFARRVSLMPEV